MSENIDDLLGPENGPKKEKDKIRVQTENRLNSLRELLSSDNTQFNADNHMVGPNDFPTSQYVKSIDYTEEQNEHTIYATKIIEDFISNYIQSEKLLASSKLINNKNRQIEDLSDLQFLVKNTQRNLILVQESIDGGDMSEGMFKLSKELTADLRASIEARSKQSAKCETYWENYANQFGLTGNDEKTIQEDEKTSDTAIKTTIIDPTMLNKMIDDHVKESDDRIRAERKANEKKAD